MNSSNSGIISTEFVNVSDSFSDYSDVSQGNYNRLVKAKRFGKWHIIKGLKAEYSDKIVFVELLKKEFDLGIALDHPNIIRTIGKESDSHIGDCIILEYIDGTTLKQWLTTKPSKSERRRVVMQLLEAMGYYHSKGVIHRDLKPENILITRNGANVKVIDFGLSDSDEYAILKQPAGSRQYSAPEQSERGKNVDLRADIYAFGCILQEFDLTGVYKRITSKATQKAPADRYANAKEIVSTIQNRHRIHIAEAIVFSLLLMIFGILSLFKHAPQPNAQISTSHTTVKEVLRDTVVSIKEVPVIVEKVVLKNIEESDSTYIARKNWKKAKTEYATREINNITAQMKEIAMKSKTKKAYYEAINKIDFSNQYSILREELIKDIPKESDFYFEFENKIAVIYGNKHMEIFKIVDKLPQE